jgi:hypothetical protein
VFRTTILGLVPGVAHVDLGRAKRGLLYFFLFALSINGALMAPILDWGRGAQWGFAGAAAAVWVAVFVGALRTARKAAAPPPATPPSPPAATPPAAEPAEAKKETHA